MGEEKAEAMLARCESEGKSFERLMVSKINMRKVG
jgi:hypothetical protein